MPKPKINNRKLLRLVDTEGLNQSQAAKRIGVCRQAISKRLQELRGRTTRVVVAKKLEQIVDHKIDTMEQLSKINKHANEILDLLMAWQRGDPEALQVLESQQRQIKIGAEEIPITEFKIKDPRELALKAMGEIRNQLKLQLDIFETIYSLQAAGEFQQEILKVIGEIAPDVRTKIIDRLNEGRTIRSVVKFN